MINGILFGNIPNGTHLFLLLSYTLEEQSFLQRQVYSE